MLKRFAVFAFAAGLAAHAALAESMQATRAWVTNYVNDQISKSVIVTERDEDGVSYSLGGHTIRVQHSTVTTIVVRAVSPLMERLGFVDGMALPIDYGEGPSETNLFAEAVFRNGTRKLYASTTNYYYIVQEPIDDYEAGTVFQSVTYQHRMYLLEPGATPTNALCWLAWTKVQPMKAERLLDGRMTGLRVQP